MPEQERKPLPERKEIKAIKEELGVKYTVALRIYQNEDIRKIKDELGISYVEAFKIFEDRVNDEQS
jgi:hypothetical protein